MTRRTTILLSFFVVASLLYYYLSSVEYSPRSDEFKLRESPGRDGVGAAAAGAAEDQPPTQDPRARKAMMKRLRFAADEGKDGTVPGSGAGTVRVGTRWQTASRRVVKTVREETRIAEARSPDNLGDFAEVLIDAQRKALQMLEKATKGHWNLKRLAPELGGNPVRNVILTTWRSGSTFLGDLVTSHPGTFYHYEPLLHFGINRVLTPDGVGGDVYDGRKAVNTLRDLMNCRYGNLTDYLNYGMTHPYLMSHNDPVWSKCRRVFNTTEAVAEDGNDDPGSKGEYKNGGGATTNGVGAATSQVVQVSDWSLCFNGDFLGRFCSLFPIQAVKTVRLGLAAAEPLLADSKLNLRILVLVRDPRGTMQSRKHRDWCPGHPDCDDPSHLCSDMVADFQAAKELTRRYPGKIRVERYEDVSTDLETSVPSIFKFLRLSLTNRTRAFLDSHTKVNYGGVSSTYRDSKRAPFEWRFKLTKEEVEDIESPCLPAMGLWGYKRFDVVNMTSDELERFQPLVPGFKLDFNEPSWKRKKRG